MADGQEQAVALAIIFMLLPVVAVALRFRAKSIVKGPTTHDDYMILLALVNVDACCGNIMSDFALKAFTVGNGICQLLGE